MRAPVYPTKFKVRSVVIVFWLFLVALLTGCASRTGLVITRRDAKFALGANSTTCLATHAAPRDSELTLQRHLLIALRNCGFTLVSHEQADFTLTFWLDDSCETDKKVVYYQIGNWSDMQPLPISRTYRAPGQVVYPASPIVGQRIVDSDY